MQSKGLSRVYSNTTAGDPQSDPQKAETQNWAQAGLPPPTPVGKKTTSHIHLLPSAPGTVLALGHTAHIWKAEKEAVDLPGLVASVFVFSILFWRGGICVCVSLHWVFLVCGLSLVVENRVYSLVMMCGLLIAMASHVEHMPSGPRL